MTPAAGSFLTLLGRDDRAAFDAIGRRRAYRKGGFLLREGERSDHAFVIRQGRIKIVATTASGHEVLLAVRGAGELVGELAALTAADAARTASLVALSPVEAQVVTATELLDYLERRPKVLMLVVRLIMDRLRDSDRRRIEFGSQPTMGRVAGYLAEMAERDGRVVPDGIAIATALSQEELAGYIVASRESVARALTALRREGLISTARRSIVVHDLPGLLRYRQ
jgi:CRP/FNR family transcriptional regulator, cyclic AMP receptor protein